MNVRLANLKAIRRRLPCYAFSRTDIGTWNQGGKRLSLGRHFLHVNYGWAAALVCTHLPVKPMMLFASHAPCDVWGKPRWRLTAAFCNADWQVHVAGVEHSHYPRDGEEKNHKKGAYAKLYSEGEELRVHLLNGDSQVISSPNILLHRPLLSYCRPRVEPTAASRPKGLSLPMPKSRKFARVRELGSDLPRLALAPARSPPSVVSTIRNRETLMAVQ